MTAPDAPPCGDEVYWYIRESALSGAANDGWHYFDRAEAVRDLRQLRCQIRDARTFVLVRVTRRKVTTPVGYVARAVAAEREACAEVCARLRDAYVGNVPAWHAADDCAMRIGDRGAEARRKVTR